MYISSTLSKPYETDKHQIWNRGYLEELDGRGNHRELLSIICIILLFYLEISESGMTEYLS